jgi:lipopolysaccharide exporter
MQNQFVVNEKYGAVRLFLFEKLKHSPFVKNVLVVMSGSALAQALTLVLSPVISRLYSPVDFGVFGSFMAILGIVASGITLDFSQALMLPKEDAEGIGLLATACLSTLTIASICLVICIFAPRFVLGLMKGSNAWLLPLLIVAIISSGLGQTFQGWCVRTKAFKKTSAAQVIRSVSTNGGQVSLGYMNGGSLGLIIAMVIGDVFSSLSMAKGAIRGLRAAWPSFQSGRLWPLAKRYRDFPLYSATTNIINSVSMGLPVFLLAHYFGIAFAGAYVFGLRLVQAPMELVLRALRQVLYQKTSETRNEGGRLVPLYTKITGGLFLLGLIPSVMLVMWAPRIFSWAFGHQWYTAGLLARSLVVWLLFLFCNLPAVLFSQVMRLQRRMFLYNIALLSARAIALIIGGTFLSVYQTVFLYSMVGAVMNIIFIVIIGIAARRFDHASGDLDIA